ncbi:MAG: hypothetical protein ABIP27_00765 [Flavobacterium circumlabens]|uniref:Uncharacterized protein n=1 Tax=Flavobacterium circumlabens TaxID=2133765 RepID=A0A4Y7UDV9_9FLAO|nr:MULTISPECIES: hypothetical protein [Flavobacterium]QSB28388.1 hypothetical protein HAV12_006550 [Flavobacterium sp. CLA17]TCN58598.1 hypothetical protein EV142_10333 [Flavobacterium circumlabens]TEB44029.1 hypothetical protein D0809_09650 [Flavobacterium circumlabens]
MDIAELKLDLIKKIMETNDLDLLLKIKSLLDSGESGEDLSSVNEPVAAYEKLKTKNIRIFSEAEQKKINIALQQYENGDFVSNEEAQIELEQWFKEQEK